MPTEGQSPLVQKKAESVHVETDRNPLVFPFKTTQSLPFALRPADEPHNRKTTEDTETRKQRSDEPRDAEEDKSKKTGGRPKGNTMKNDTFNQIINANLASIDPGFGQFALAKASSDLMKKVLNK
mgnify:CR=1 FL=1